MYGEEIIIFIMDFQTVRKLRPNPPRPNFESIAEMNLMGGIAAGDAVHGDAALREHLTQCSFRGSGNKERQNIQKGAGSGGYGFHLALVTDQQTGGIGKSDRNSIGSDE